MKWIFSLAIVVLACTACKKVERASPLYAHWVLNATSQPYSPDPAWKPNIVMNGTINFSLQRNGTFLGNKGSSLRLLNKGTYTLTDSAHTGIKILTFSNADIFPQKVYIQFITRNELIMDSAMGQQPANYTRMKFTQVLRYD